MQHIGAVAGACKFPSIGDESDRLEGRILTMLRNHSHVFVSQLVRFRRRFKTEPLVTVFPMIPLHSLHARIPSATPLNLDDNIIPIYTSFKLELIEHQTAKPFSCWRAPKPSLGPFEVYVGSFKSSGTVLSIKCKELVFPMHPWKIFTSPLRSELARAL